MSGYMLPVDPLVYRADWTCEVCHTTVPFKTVDDVITTIESQVNGRFFWCVLSRALIGEVL